MGFARGMGEVECAGVYEDPGVEVDWVGGSGDVRMFWGVR